MSADVHYGERNYVKRRRSDGVYEYMFYNIGSIDTAKAKAFARPRMHSATYYPDRAVCRASVWVPPTPDDAGA